MSTKEADRLVHDIEANPSKFEELKTLGKDGKADEVFQRVKDMGYDATTDEIREAFLEQMSTKLDQKQLDEVSAGISDAAAVGAGVAAGAAVGVGAGVAIATAVIITGSAAAAAAI